MIPYDHRGHIEQYVGLAQSENLYYGSLFSIRSCTKTEVIRLQGTQEAVGKPTNSKISSAERLEEFGEHVVT